MSENPVVNPPAAGAKIEIRWGGRTFQFDSKAEALKAGFHLEDPAIIEKPEKR